MKILPDHWQARVPQFDAKAYKIRDDFFSGDPTRKPDDVVMANLVRAAAIYYVAGQFCERVLEEQKAMEHVHPAINRVLRRPGSVRDSRPEKIKDKLAKGLPVNYSKKPEKIADQALGFAAHEIFLRLSVGSNRPRGGWDSYYKRESRPTSRKPPQDAKTVRRPASVQRILERLLLIVDPERLLPDAPPDRRPPKPGFYTWLKERHRRQE